jgi:hypothetical protein
MGRRSLEEYLAYEICAHTFSLSTILELVKSSSLVPDIHQYECLGCRFVSFNSESN